MPTPRRRQLLGIILAGFFPTVVSAVSSAADRDPTHSVNAPGASSRTSPPPGTRIASIVWCSSLRRTARSQHLAGELLGPGQPFVSCWQTSMSTFSGSPR